MSRNDPPVVNRDVALQVKLAVMELDHGEASAADDVDFVHAGDAALQDCRHQFQDLCWRGCGQVDIRQDGVLRASIVRRALPCLKERRQKDGIFTAQKTVPLSSILTKT